MAATKTEDKKGVYSYEHLIWEHQEVGKKYHQFAKNLLKNLINRITTEHDNKIQRILFNVISIIIQQTKAVPSHIYFDDFGFSLNLLLVFPYKQFKKYEDVIYNVMPKLQKLSVKNENRDFKWHLVSDENLNHEILIDEYPAILQVSTK